MSHSYIEPEAPDSWAAELAHWLQQQEAIASVSYPSLESHPQEALARKQMKQGGGIVTCTFKDGAAAVMRFVNALELVSRSSNLDDTRIIVTHPASTTHSKLKEEERLAVGITPGLLRIGVGLEDLIDVKADFELGFKATME